LVSAQRSFRQGREAAVRTLDGSRTKTLPDALQGEILPCNDAGLNIPYIHPRGEEISESERNPGYISRRWVVECFHFWMNRFRKLIPRYEKTDLSYCALPLP
jgi:transposase